MKLVVGLGNPGRKYAETRHNVGFMVVQQLVQRFGAGSVKRRFDAETVDASIADERVVLLAPQTYMNRSGASVVAARDFFKLTNESILVVCDDFALPLGRLRFRQRGSAGGQKGLADVMQRLGSQEVSRLRVGIEPPPPEWDVADYVLSKFRKDETPVIDSAVRLAADGVADWIRHGTEYCMNRYNGIN